MPIVEPQGDHQGLVTAGYVLAVLVAPVGFVVGAVLLAKDRAGHGAAIIVISVALIGAGLAAFSGGDGPTYEITPAATPISDPDATYRTLGYNSAEECAQSQEYLTLAGCRAP